MQLRHLRHVVRPQRRRQDLDQQARGRVEHGQHVRRGKAATGLLLPGLPEVIAQVRRCPTSRNCCRRQRTCDARASAAGRDRYCAAWHVCSSSAASGQRQPGTRFAIGSPEQANCARRTTWLQAVLPCSTCKKNAHTVSAGPSSRCRQMMPHLAACLHDRRGTQMSGDVTLDSATACTILADMVGPLVGVFVIHTNHSDRRLGHSLAPHSKAAPC